MNREKLKASFLDASIFYMASPCVIQMNSGDHGKLIGEVCPGRPVLWRCEWGRNTEKYRRGVDGVWPSVDLGRLSGRKLSERARSPMISLYFHSCQPLPLQMSNSIRSLATYQGIEPLWKCTKRQRYFGKHIMLTAMGDKYWLSFRNVLGLLLPMCCVQKLSQTLWL